MAEEKPAFKISILASGSSGNSLYIESDKKRLLVDAGLSGKKITSLLAQIDRTPDQLDGILVTHEHRDHIHGVGVLARKYHLDVFANEKTWEAIKSQTQFHKLTYKFDDRKIYHYTTYYDVIFDGGNK